MMIRFYLAFAIGTIVWMPVVAPHGRHQEPPTTRPTPGTIPVLARNHVFQLTQSPSQMVRDLTPNATLLCALNAPPGASSVKDVSRIRILKADVYSQWHLVAELREQEVGVHLYDNVQAEGLIDPDVSKSYLKIVWPVVTASTMGRYRCEVVGFDNNLNIAIESSNMAVLVEHSITAKEVLDLLLKDRTQFHYELDLQRREENLQLQNLAQDLNDTLLLQVSVMRSIEANLTACCQRATNLATSTQNKYDELYRNMTSLKQSLLHFTDALPWPEDAFSLLQPASGCPKLSDWSSGYVKIHTESQGKNTNYVSSPSHMVPNTQVIDGTENFMNLRFCTAPAANRGLAWPRGAYCINRHGITCPDGFHGGYVAMDEEDSSTAGTQGGNFPSFRRTGTYLLMDFCCREDGSPHHPVILPTAYPFYLYRYNGTCQDVTNMQVSEEFITIDTEDLANGDRYENRYHPDGALDEVNLIVCHYQPVYSHVIN